MAESMIQVALNSEQQARVRLRAKELGISKAEYIRRLVDQDLAHIPTQADLNLDHRVVRIRW